ncbi:UMP-CMP kinase-like [Bidens hawaiensis]|uniref:UMP-CMP kinase-like n=1 Tax=Bidens hawaiensis TaxID=980011 RepID=UPI00404B55E9
MLRRVSPLLKLISGAKSSVLNQLSLVFAVCDFDLMSCARLIDHVNVNCLRSLLLMSVLLEEIRLVDEPNVHLILLECCNEKVAYGLNFLEAFSTDSLKQAEAGIVSKPRTPIINFVLGGPGVGKGTQCTRIAETFGFTHLSVGDLLRKEISSNTEYGTMILETITKGKIVASEVTVKLLKTAIESSETDRFLIDGFPRSEENRVAYEQIIGIEPEVVLFFDCNEEEMLKRVLHRNQGRVDDNIDTTMQRLKVFEAYTLPVIRYYSQKGKLHKINAIGTEDEIFERVRPIFAKYQGT